MRREPQRKGANAIEFAMLLPLYVSFIFGTIAFSWYFFQGTEIKTAAVDACRTASLIDPGPGEQDLQLLTDAAEQFIKNSLEQCDDGGTGCTYNVQVVHSPPFRTIECEITVTVPMLVGIPGMPAFKLDQIQATGARRLEHQVY